ncbi:MAG: peptidoglycan binding domain-containing protein [Clostridium sp.]|nr:peptidoglycan binding domain-containing protein [Clostridium sp.]
MDKLNIGFNNKKIVISIAIIVVMYFLGGIYFYSHYAFNTYINGINVSCKSTDNAARKIIDSFDNYELQLNEKNGMQETIYGQDINLNCSCSRDKLQEIQKKQKSYLWIISLPKKENYEISDLVYYDKDKLSNIISNLKCISGNDIIEPSNPYFEYIDGKYNVTSEVYGNKVNTDLFNEAVKKAIDSGKKNIDLDSENCYEKPKYTLKSDKVLKTKEILDKYVSSKIIYDFDEETETVDGDTINKWLKINDDLDVEFDKENVKEYIEGLCKKYNTVGQEREFKTSSGKNITIKGGYYGWKINSDEEINSLIENIEKGQNIMKEPIYSQKAVSRKKDDIGDTYVEVNITRQHLWFYKNGKLVTQGDVVTGNINKGCATSLGVYPLNYKQKNATLKGFGYSSPVKYWMPFNGNIGIHDASWRSSFGGDIYKSNGTHGCVNAPQYLAKAIYEEIDSGIPIICYEEK